MMEQEAMTFGLDLKFFEWVESELLLPSGWKLNKSSPC